MLSRIQIGNTRPDEMATAARPSGRRWRLGVLLSLAILTAATAQSADYYKLENVKRIDKDLYRSGKILIETRYCYHLTLGEEAVLKYEGSGDYSGSTIIWDDSSTCEVRKVVTI